MELVIDYIWCDVHGCIHEATYDPYDYGYEHTGEAPECTIADWHKLWIGGYVFNLQEDDDG